MVSSTPVSKEKQQEWKAVIESDPELFLALAEETPIGRRILAAIRRDEEGKALQEQAERTNTATRKVTADEALGALERLDRTQYTRERTAFMTGAGQHGYVSGNIPFESLVTLVEYARQQVVNENPDMYVLQDSRDHADNKMLFWAKDATGYTTDLNKAHRFTEAEAQAQHLERPSDIPHRVGDLSPATAQMLSDAAQQIARSKRHQRTATDPTAMPEPKGVNLRAMDARSNLTDEHANSLASLKEMFGQDPHTDDTVLLVARAESPDLLETVMVNPDEHQVANFATDDTRVTQTMPLADFAASFWRYPNAHNAMSYNSWQQFLEIVTPHLSKLEQQGRIPASLSSNLPADLPPKVAQERMALLDAFASPENLKVKIQLADICMASLYGEPVKDSLFKGKDKQPGWHERLSYHDLGTLYEYASHIGATVTEIANAIHDSARRDQEIDVEQRFSLALARQTEGEINHMIDIQQSRAAKDQNLDLIGQAPDSDDNHPSMTN